jgi:ABC-type uncharacterized transport system substrate-binding protein
MHMLHVEKQLLCPTLFIIVLCVGSDVIAHPHVFIVQRLKIVFDDQCLAGFGVEWVTDFNAILKNGKLCYYFFVPCHVNAHEFFKEIVITTYDPTYYTAVFFAKKRPARVENEDRFVIESAIIEDKSTSIYFGMVNPFL